MKEYEVNCVNKPNRSSAHEHITHIGHSANKWRLRQRQAAWPVSDNYLGRSTGVVVAG
ncbi:hypothetical protein [Pandoraea vervacti]|uniref:hypothetical protein n=1 Tax=Pandoraea vervacti TaxID=656178 RepID=UPI000AE374FF|nr:hypothetical protein [Pandoraea vervacti]